MPGALLVMNQPSLEKFAPKVRKGGLIVVNTSLIPIRADRRTRGPVSRHPYRGG